MIAPDPHPFQPGDRVRYINPKRYGNANVCGRLHCVARVGWLVGGYGPPLPQIELVGVTNKLGPGPGFSASVFRLVARPCGVSA